MSGSLLDTLRQRIAQSTENEELRRVQDLGAGMLASGSPNFFTMLGAGVQAQRQGDAARMEELRRIAEAEQNARRIANEEAFRTEQNRIQAERYAAEAPLRAAQAQYYLRGGAAGVGGGGGSATGAARPLSAAQLSALGRAAETHARQTIREPEPNSIEALRDTPELQRQREDARRRAAEAYIERQLALLRQQPAGGGIPSAPPADTAAPPATPAVPRITVGPTGRPVQAQ